MATYGDRYLFTFQSTGAATVSRQLSQMTTQANALAHALNALANAYNNARSAMGSGLPTTLQNVRIQNVNQVATPGGTNVIGGVNQGGVGRTGGGGGGGGSGSRDFSPLARLGSHIQYIAQGIAIYKVFQLATEGAMAWAKAQAMLDQQVAEFSISLMAGKRDAEAYIGTMMQISRSTGIAPSEIGPGLTVQQRVHGAPSDLALRAAQVQRVTGADNLTIERDLLSLKKQFPDKGLINILDAFTGAMRRSTLSAAEFFDLLESAGPLSKQFNADMEDILGMFAGLSTATGESGPAIELYMRQLERIYTEDSTRSAVEARIGPVTSMNVQTGMEKRRPMPDILKAISGLGQDDIMAIAQTIPNMLGQQNRQMFLAMMQDWEGVADAMSGARSAAGEFEQQVEVMSKTWDAKVQGMTSAWERYLMSIRYGANEIKGIFDAIGGWLDKRATLNMFDQMAEERGLIRTTQGGRTGLAYESTFDPTGLGSYGKWYGGADQYTRETGMQAFGQGGMAMPDYVRWQVDQWLKEQAAQQNRFKDEERRLGMMTGGGSRTAGQWMPGVPLMPSSTLSVPEGANLKVLQELADKQFRAIMDSYKNMMVDGKTPYKGMTDAQILNAVDPENKDPVTSVLAIKENGEAVEILKGRYSDLTTVMKEHGSEILRQAPKPGQPGYVGPVFQGPKNYIGTMGSTFETGMAPGKFNTGAFMKAYNDVLNAQIQGARANFEHLSGATDAEVKRFLGIMEQPVTALDTTGAAAGRMSVDLNVAATALDIVAAAAAGLAGFTYMTPPDGMSDADYISRLQSGANDLAWQGARYGIGTGPVSQQNVRLPSGAVYPVNASPETLGQANADLTYERSQQAAADAEAKRIAGEQERLAREQLQTQKQIARGIEGMIDSLIGATEVTQTQMLQAEYGGKGGPTGPVVARWDEPVRRVRDAVNRRIDLKGGTDLGPWAGYAQSMGIDLTNPATAASTGEEFERKWYNFLLPEQTYVEAGSKDAIVANAQRKMEEMKGQQQGKTMVAGWLKEAGITGDMADYFAAEASGELTPFEKMLFGNQPPAKVAQRIQPAGKAIGGGVTEGFKEAMGTDGPMKLFLEGFKPNDEKQREQLKTAGSDAGKVILEGVTSAYTGKMLDAIVKAVLAEIQQYL